MGKHRSEYQLLSVGKEIEQLRKQQMELILLLIGEPIDPKTLVFDGKKFKAAKVK